MAGLECTQAERDALADAIKGGVLKVQFADKSVTYKSSAEQKTTLAEMDEYLAGTSAPTRYARAGFRRE